MREVKVVRHKREVTTRRVQKRRRIPPPAQGEVPLLEAEIVTPEETGIDEPVQEEAEPEPEYEDDYDPTPGEEQGNGNNNGSSTSYRNAFSSIILIGLIITAGFGAMISFDIASEPAAGINFEGSIDTNTTWSENMTITGDTTIEEGATLYILPGVNVWFKSNVRFYVKGTLYANGTEGNLINFTSSSNNPWKGIWNRIQLRSTASGRMNYCNISYALYGVDFYQADYFTIENSSFIKNRYAVYMRSNANYNTFKNNTMFDNGWGYGIFMSYCRYNTFENNSLAGNTYNFYITGNNIVYFTHYFVNDSNKAEGKPMYYWLDRSDEVVPEDAGFVGLVGCTNMTVANMEIRKSGEGIVLAYTSLSRINNVTLRNNNYGLYFYQAGADNLVTNVTAYSNSYGLYFHYAYNNKLRDNTFKDNTYNVYFVGSSQNYFEHDIDTSNIVQDNKPMIYWVDRHYETVPANAGFVAVIGSTNITVSDVSVRRNAQGILVAHSDNVKIENVYLNKNYYATYFYRTTGKITMSNSTVLDNKRGGYFYRAHDTTISSTVYDTNYDAFTIRDTKRLELTNCSIIASSRWNIDTATGSTTTLLNTTFNPNKVKIKDANTELTVKWFMNVRAVNDLGAPVNFRIIIRDGNSNIVTDRNVVGSLYWTECVGYRQTPSKIFYEYNNYTAEARNATTALVRELNMTYSRTVKFVFNAKPHGILPEFLEFEEDSWLEIDLSKYFSDYNELTYQTYVFKNLEVDLNSASEIANITATPDWCGSGSITIRVIDEHGAFIESTAWINVTPVNDAPEFARPVPHIHLTEGASSYQFDLANYIYDPDWAGCGDVVKWYIEGEDANAVQVTGENSTSTIMTISVIDPDYYGSHKLQLFLEDSEGAVTSRDLWLNITARNDPPELTRGIVSPLRGDTNTMFQFSVVYTDIEGDLPEVVQLVLDNVGYPMTEENSSDVDTTDGKIYVYSGKLAEPGAHEYSFCAMDRYRAAGSSASANGLYVDEPVETTGSVSGFVLDSAFELGLEGAHITLFHGLNGTPAANGTTSSGAHGEFQYTELPSGIYSIEIEMPGFETYEIESLLVNPGEVLTEGLTVKLDKEEPEPVVPTTDTDITGVDIELYSESLEPKVGDIVTFNGSATDADGDLLLFYWDFGDEGVMPIGGSVTHNYTSAGTYNITLMVLDSDGNTASARRTIIIKAEPVDPNGKAAVEESSDDKYGSNVWLAGIFICVALLCIIIPLLMLYTRRRKRAKAAARKLKVLKKQMMLKAAAGVHTARMMGSGQQGAAVQMHGAHVQPRPQLAPTADVQPPTPMPRPALPPTPEPEPEPVSEVYDAEIVEPGMAEEEIAELPDMVEVPEEERVVEPEDFLRDISLPGDDEDELVLDFKRPKKRE
jgi:parallel beta-helix repeat protein